MRKGRDEILRNLKRALEGVEPGSYDLSSVQSISFSDPVEQFIKMVMAVGGEVIRKPADQLDGWLAEAFPGKEILNALDGDFDRFQNQATDVLVIRSECGVAENGAIWVGMSHPEGTAHRALLFLADTLVILTHPTKIVHTMHEAYARLKGSSFDYGSFISGPSKTADIEQALVIGAQGPGRAVVWLDSE